MSQIEPPFEAEIVHELPDGLAALVGRVVVTYAKLEHKLTMLSALLLQLNKAESRITLRTPRATERLDMALDLFAVKNITIKMDFVALRQTLERATSGRDILAHGLWLEHPETKELYLRLTRGKWPKNMTRGTTVTRAVFPQSIPYNEENCKATLALIQQALSGVDQLGEEIDAALQAFPERFREPSPLLNPLGGRTPKGRETPP